MNEQGTGDQKKSAFEILKETREGRQALKGLVGPLFVSLWTDVLHMVFEWFPHEPGDNSENERAFQALRHRVLRKGNEAKRQMEAVTEDFAVAQIRTRVVTDRIVAPTHGPFALPVGVQMPPKDRS